MRVIGISMRELNYSPNSGKVDVLDALSQDFISFCQLLNLKFIPLANSGEDIIELVKRVKLDGLILSGGGDIGQQPKRDLTEKLLLEYAIKTKIPLLGICRGFQFIQHYFGGNFCEDEEHIAKKHEVLWLADNKKICTNSFHKFTIKKLIAPLKPLAICQDKTVEAAYFDNIAGMMWHPERELELDSTIKNWVGNFFNS